MKRATNMRGRSSVSRARLKVESADANPSIRALLDHLGRLLAREYVTLLRGGEHSDSTKDAKR